MDSATPMMRQYKRIKQKHRDAILFFRLGDFYEMFERDAKEASALLGLTLTSRNSVPMCGIPYHAAHPYIARLLRAGRKIAICEQLTLPTGGKGIADREVVEIITPGTVVDEDYLDEKTNNYLVAIARSKNAVSLSFVDLSTGEFAATSFPWDERADRLAKELGRLRPRELIVQESLFDEDPVVNRILKERDLLLNRYPDWSFDLKAGAEALKTQFGVANLRGFGLDENAAEIVSAAVILEYISDTAGGLLPHIRAIRRYTDDESVSLDESTQRNLELVGNLHDGSRRFTLIESLDFTRTAMGARLLRSWLLRPLRDTAAIEVRLERVDSLYRNQILLSSLRELIGGVLDLERLCARVALDRAHAKDLVAIRNSLACSYRISALLFETGELFGGLDDESSHRVVEIEELLRRSIDEDPSILLTEGRLIKTGYNAELDEIRATRDNSKEILDEYLAEERQNTGIGSLKIRYNKIIGYFFEVTKANLQAVPSHFIRRQSLVGSERFTTDRLIELETSLNNATDRIVELERELFLEVRRQVKERLDTLLDLSRYLAMLDCVQSFAQAATVHGYTRPRVESSSRISISAGRHPVVENTIPAGDFVPNDCELDADAHSFALITGPNMAGKSTYLRQVALIVLMAQAGSFVPAHDVAIGVVDRIFCRVGAQDNLARGESTFLVEMNETANILRSATKASLIIMDEVGRGTGTNDGLAIAWAVSEHLLETLAAKTLFATHYHELTDIRHAKMRNLSMEVLEKKDEIVFLKRVKEGPSENSYGIHVARLAGLPEQVVKRAREILSALLEIQGSRRPTLPGSEEPETERKTEEGHQSSLFAPHDLVCDEILSLDVDATTPIEALTHIERWKKQLRGER